MHIIIESWLSTKTEKQIMISRVFPRGGSEMKANRFFYVIVAFLVLTVGCAATISSTIDPNAPVIAFRGFGLNKGVLGTEIPQVNDTRQMYTDIQYYLSANIVTHKSPLKSIIHRFCITDLEGNWDPKLCTEKSFPVGTNPSFAWVGTSKTMPTIEKERIKLELWVEDTDGRKSNIISTGPAILIPRIDISDPNPFVGIWAGNWQLTPTETVPITLIVKRVKGKKAAVVYLLGRYRDRGPLRVATEAEVEGNVLNLEIAWATMTFTLDERKLAAQSRSVRGGSSIFADLSLTPIPKTQ